MVYSRNSILLDILNMVMGTCVVVMDTIRIIAMSV